MGKMDSRTKTIVPKKKRRSTAKCTYKYAYYDEDGKRRGKTFSASTMTEAKLEAMRWEYERKKEKKPYMSLTEAVERYISVKAPSLSPSTVASYQMMYETHIKDSELGRESVFAVDDVKAQKWVSDLAIKGLSSKTIKNCLSLVSASLRMFAKANISVTIPQTRKKELYCPSTEDLQKLLEYLREHKRDALERATLLAAFGPLRRGEICALTSEDVDFKNNTVTVNKSLVRSSDGRWLVKAPKTESSYRTVMLPEFVMEKLKGIDGRLVEYTPHSLGWMFREAVFATGLPHFRFHDLRHYAASIMHYQGISDKTIQARGGWASNHVMKRVYQNRIEDETRRENESANAYFSEKFSS